MTDRALIDSNILVYIDDAGDRPRQERAFATFERLVRAQRAVVSTHVLQEYSYVATRKLGVPVDNAREKVRLHASLPVVPVDVALILAAIDLHERHRIAFWDALVVQAAVAGGCGELVSEDLQHGRTIEGVRIVDPFR